MCMGKIWHYLIGGANPSKLLGCQTSYHNNYRVHSGKRYYYGDELPDVLEVSDHHWNMSRRNVVHGYQYFSVRALCNWWNHTWALIISPQKIIYQLCTVIPGFLGQRLAKYSFWLAIQSLTQRRSCFRCLHHSFVDWRSPRTACYLYGTTHRWSIGEIYTCHSREKYSHEAIFTARSPPSLY